MIFDLNGRQVFDLLQIWVDVAGRFKVSSFHLFE